MSKNTEINFVGQPILGQILKMIPRAVFNRLQDQHNTNRYYKEFKTWDHFVSVMFGILSRCDSISEILSGMAGMSGKLEHLGIQKVPAKSTFSDGMRKRKDKFFEELYFALVAQYKSSLSDSKVISKQFDQMLLIDSTTIRLFSEVLKGVGRNRKDDGKKKGGAKVHMVIDAHQQIGQFIAITAAKVHDKKFLEMFSPQPNSLIVMDRAYNHYLQFANWTDKKVYFVTRKKSNTKFTPIEVPYDNELIENKLKNKEQGVHKDQLITLEYKDGKEKKQLTLRMVTYYDEKGRKYDFITNSMSQLTAQEVAACYKKRWDIELLFKKLKQNFQLTYFYGENETAIKTQIWCTLIAQLLITVLQRQNAPTKAFSTVASTVRIHLISMLDVKEIIRGDHRYYAKESPMAGNMDLFGFIIPKRKERKRRIRQKTKEGHLLDLLILPNNSIDNQMINSG